MSFPSVLDTIQHRHCHLRGSRTAYEKFIFIVPISLIEIELHEIGLDIVLFSRQDQDKIFN